MASSSRYVAERIERAADVVYAYVSNPAHLPQWAPGLGSAVEQVEDDWFVETSMGRVRVTFAEPNAYGVLDHDVTPPSGQTFTNPMRVVPDGDGCEVSFTVRRTPEMSDEDLARDAELVAADLARLKGILEGRPQPES
jgi:Polyketide cyclase / dehydrase and lipid transport